MLNYEIDPAILEPYLPAGTQLDTWNGKHYVSVVGLLFLNTRLYGVSIPFHRDFEELNLRFYVRREAAGQVRRGVVFVKEIVPKPAITMVARVMYNENYVTMPMSHTVSQSGEALSVAYRWRQREVAHSLAVRAEGRPVLIEDDTEEEFIAEHYWGYVGQRDGGTLEYEVEHPRWPRLAHQGRHTRLRCGAALRQRIRSAHQGSSGVGPTRRRLARRRPQGRANLTLIPHMFNGPNCRSVPRAKRRETVKKLSKF